MKPGTQVSSPQALSRRRFLKVSGSITFLIAAQGILPGCQVKDSEALARIASDLNAWVEVRSDGAVIILNPAAEMGQGSMTALAVVVAEEMDADWSKVHIEHSPIEPETYGLTWSRELGGPMITVGSRTVQGYYQHLRQAGAQARRLLMQAAAGKWELPVEALRTEPGVVVHDDSGRRLTYGEIAAFIEAPESVPDIPADQLKDPADFRLIGQVLPRFDIPAKVDGSARYAIDVQVPGMVYGLINRSKVREFAAQTVEDFDVRCGGTQAAAKSLSGGNLQKFIVGREMSQQPEILVASQPTWGVDVGAATAIRQALIDLRNDGAAVLVVSEELDELFEICDRLIVIAGGRISPSRKPSETNMEEVGLWMSGMWDEAGAGAARTEAGETAHVD